jgi:hypothetical protein
MIRIPVRVLASPLRAQAEQLEHFAWLGVPTELRFFEDRHAVAMHLEPSAARRNQLYLLTRYGAANLRRQTDGAWLVISDGTVLDRDHRPPVEDLRDYLPLAVAAIGGHALRPFIDVERVPVGERIEDQRVASLGLVPPHRTNPEKHDVSLA